MRYLLAIWKATRPSNSGEGWETMRRELSFLYSRFCEYLLLWCLFIDQSFKLFSYCTFMIRVIWLLDSFPLFLKLCSLRTRHFRHLCDNFSCIWNFDASSDANTDLSSLSQCYNRWDPSWGHFDNVPVPRLHAAYSPSHVLILDTTDSSQCCPGFKKTSAPILHLGHDSYTFSYTVICFWMPTQLHACRDQQGLVCMLVHIHGVASCHSSSPALFWFTLLCSPSGSLFFPL